MKKARRDIDLEQYYTQPEIAKELIEETISFLNLDKKEINIIEPSAGDGSFSNSIIELGFTNYKFYDIEPAADNIEKKDFFTILNDDFFTNSLVIGNPPFGYKGKMAIDFINHSFELGAKYVAFILPYTFSRFSVQNKINKNSNLIYERELKDNLYTNYKNNKTYEIRSLFQIWELNSNKPNLRKKRNRKKHPDFGIHMYNLDKNRVSMKWFKEPWDFCIYRQGFYDYNKRFYPEDFESLDLDKYQYMIFKANNRFVLDNLINMDFEELSKNNLIRPGVSVGDIVEAYYSTHELFTGKIIKMEISLNKNHKIDDFIENITKLFDKNKIIIDDLDKGKGRNIFIHLDDKDMINLEKIEKFSYSNNVTLKEITISY